MALPPSVPTSFVPHRSATPSVRRPLDLGGAFAFLGYGILALSIVIAGGIFFYSRILASEQSSKEADLAKAEQSIDQATVESFVRLKDRLSSGKELLNSHVALSGAFDLLEKLTVSSVRIASLQANITDAGAATLILSGSAKSFNALAVESQTLASDPRVKDAIFSGLQIGNGGVVTFTLNATIDPKLIAYAAGGAASATTTTP